jgi:hypothetical protein
LVIGGLRILAIVGSDCVSGGHGEIRRESIEREPGDFTSFARFAILGAAAGDTAEIGGRNPVLVFQRQDVVGDTEETLDGDFDADFLAGFAECACCESFQVLQLATDDAPATRFGRQIAKREEYAAALIEDEDTNANSGKRSGCGEIVFRGHGWRWKRASHMADAPAI